MTLIIFAVPLNTSKSERPASWSVHALTRCGAGTQMHLQRLCHLSQAVASTGCTPVHCTGPRTTQRFLRLKDHLLYSGISSSQSVEEGAFLVAAGRPAYMKQ